MALIDAGQNKHEIWNFEADANIPDSLEVWQWREVGDASSANGVLPVNANYLQSLPIARNSEVGDSASAELWTDARNENNVDRLGIERLDLVSANFDQPTFRPKMHEADRYRDATRFPRYRRDAVHGLTVWVQQASA